MQLDLMRVALSPVCMPKPQVRRSQQLPPFCSPRHLIGLFTQRSTRSLVAQMFLASLHRAPDCTVEALEPNFACKVVHSCTAVQ